MRSYDGVVLGGRFRLDERIGVGGSATVYRAQDLRLGVTRAVKVLEGTGGPARDQLRARLQAEASGMARLRHPHVLVIHDVGVDGDLDFVVMDLADGGSLQQRVERQGPMAPREAVEAIIATLDALEEAHRHGIIHRDVKPANLLLDRGGRVLLADFGIALWSEEALRSTRSGVAMGSIAYMAPEQRLDAREVDARADVYAAATTLFHLLTGANPVDLFAVDERSPRLEKVPPRLRAILVRATRYAPADRHRSAAELQRALRGWMSSEEAVRELATPEGPAIGAAEHTWISDIPPHLTEAGPRTPTRIPEVDVRATVEIAGRTPLPPAAAPPVAAPPAAAPPAAAPRVAAPPAAAPRRALGRWAGVAALVVGAALVVYAWGGRPVPGTPPPVAEAPSEPPTVPDAAVATTPPAPAPTAAASAPTAAAPTAAAPAPTGAAPPAAASAPTAPAPAPTGAAPTAAAPAPTTPPPTAAALAPTAPAPTTPPPTAAALAPTAAAPTAAPAPTAPAPTAPAPTAALAPTAAPDGAASPLPAGWASRAASLSPPFGEWRLNDGGKRGYLYLWPSSDGEVVGEMVLPVPAGWSRVALAGGWDPERRRMALTAAAGDGTAGAFDLDFASSFQGFDARLTLASGQMRRLVGSR